MNEDLCVFYRPAVKFVIFTINCTKMRSRWELTALPRPPSWMREGAMGREGVEGERESVRRRREMEVGG